MFFVSDLALILSSFTAFSYVCIASLIGGSVIVFLMSLRMVPHRMHLDWMLSLLFMTVPQMFMFVELHFSHISLRDKRILSIEIRT